MQRTSSVDIGVKVPRPMNVNSMNNYSTYINLMGKLK